MTTNQVTLNKLPDFYLTREFQAEDRDPTDSGARKCQCIKSNTCLGLQQQRGCVMLKRASLVIIMRVEWSLVGSAEH